MKSTRNTGKLLVACIAFVSIIALVKAAYYRPNFFPIGLTGLNPTTQDYQNCPYGAADIPYQWRWTPDSSINNEQDLIFDLGINCIGGQDAYPTYIVDLKSTGHSENNYLHQICANAPDSNPVYIITAGYYVYHPEVFLVSADTFWHIEDGKTIIDSIIDRVGCDTFAYDTFKVWATYGNHPASAFFRSPYRGYSKKGKGEYAGFGAMQFSAYEGSVSLYNCHGTPTDANWNTFDGDSIWCAVADKAVANFQAFFENNPADTQYIWGYNLITEDPAVYRCSTYPKDPWHGCWAGVDRIFNGKNTKFKITQTTRTIHGHSQPPQHGGIRAAESDSLGVAHRMIFAKAAIAVWNRGNFNVFASLPDIDAVYCHPHGSVNIIWNYGQQDVFDYWLYGDILYPDEKAGIHNDAMYFQRYGNTPGGPSGQKRRMISTLCLEWQIDSVDITKAKARRPCPPEIRCMTYLSLSRGAKGILFHPWTYNYASLPSGTVLDPSDISVPSQRSTGKAYNLGLRDQAGYPFGMSSSPYNYVHKLNSGGTSTYWHIHNNDHTYYYLDTLIHEIKLLTPTLIQLEWVNGYSLNSTDPNWVSPCPHAYVMDVWGVDYMDLALFDHPYEPMGVEYFMLVNREGIADMTNRTATVALDAGHWPDADSLTLTDIADKLSPQTLIREGDRYVFTQVFEPGEGKLYRVSQINQEPIALSK